MTDIISWARVTDVISWAKEHIALGNIAVTVALLALGALLLFLRPRWGRRYIVAVALGYWWVSTPVGSTLLIEPLVYRFHSIDDRREGESAGAIVVLGGGTRVIKARSSVLSYPYDTTALRVLEGVRVFRLLDSRPLVVASGGRTNEVKESEGALIADALAALHVPRERIVVEDRSLTTLEQAIMVTRLLKERGIARFILVTSPTHMLRAVTVFRAQNADVIPSLAALTPERPRRWPMFMPNEDSLQVADSAVYDYAGLLYYWWRGFLRSAPAAGP